MDIARSEASAAGAAPGGTTAAAVSIAADTTTVDIAATTPAATEAGEARAKVLPLPPIGPEQPEKKEVHVAGLRDALALMLDLRASPLRKGVLWLAAGVVGVIILNMAGQVRLNAWHGDFFDAIERKSIAAVGQQVLIFLAIVAGLLSLVVAQTWLHETLKLRLREMLTHHLLDVWLVPARAYRLAIVSDVGVNPDQRIEQDVRQLAGLSADLAIGLIQQFLLLVSFIGVLWVLSSDIALPVGQTLIVIPGYMVWCALLYAAIGSWLAWRVGRPLIYLQEQLYAREADMRFALVRASESAESVAMHRGEVNERRIIDGTVGGVVDTTRRIIRAVARLTWVTSGYGWLAIIVPTLVALPGYIYGQLTLGGLMMVVGAFNQVQGALRWFVDSYARIADWRAVLHRVTEFVEALRVIDNIADDETRIQIADHPEGGLAFKDVSVLLAQGGVIIKEANAEIGPGDRVLITGESGSGKSTLFRAIAGLWPWGSGTILLPPRDSMMFMPQRPYLPLGTLRAAVTYPSPPENFSDTQVRAALARVGLADYLPMLDANERWDRILSLGEQQCLAFARLLLHRPRWVFLDEATAAMDEAAQARAMAIFDDELAEATLVSIGQRPGLERYHHRALELVTSSTGARLRRKTQGTMPRTGMLGLLLSFMRGSPRH